MGGVILIEGLDLAGKSTLVQGLQQLLTGMRVPVRLGRNSLCPENPIAELADHLRQDEGRSPLEGSYLFLSSHLWDVRHFRPPARGVHLQDSCWLRSLAFDWGTTQGKAMWAPHLRSPRIFDRVLFLTASLEQRRTRLQKRAEQGGLVDFQDRWVLHQPERFRQLESRLLEAVREHHSEVSILDTSDLNRHEVLRESLRRLDLGRIDAFSI